MEVRGLNMWFPEKNLKFGQPGYLSGQECHSLDLEGSEVQISPWKSGFFCVNSSEERFSHGTSNRLYRHGDRRGCAIVEILLLRQRVHG